jgi:hypothetical protein
MALEMHTQIPSLTIEDRSFLLTQLLYYQAFLTEYSDETMYRIRALLRQDGLISTLFSDHLTEDINHFRDTLLKLEEMKFPQHGSFADLHERLKHFLSCLINGEHEEPVRDNPNMFRRESDDH